jgi:hypothetical protein
MSEIHIESYGLGVRVRGLMHFLQQTFEFVGGD